MRIRKGDIVLEEGGTFRLGVVGGLLGNRCASVEWHDSGEWEAVYLNTWDRGEGAWIL